MANDFVPRPPPGTQPPTGWQSFGTNETPQRAPQRNPATMGFDTAGPPFPLAAAGAAFGGASAIAAAQAFSSSVGEASGEASASGAAIVTARVRAFANNVIERPDEVLGALADFSAALRGVLDEWRAARPNESERKARHDEMLEALAEVAASIDRLADAINTAFAARDARAGEPFLIGPVAEAANRVIAGSKEGWARHKGLVWSYGVRVGTSALAFRLLVLFGISADDAIKLLALPLVSDAVTAFSDKK
jgi:hypothetical protein